MADWLPSSARARRRLVRLGVVAIVGGGIAIGVTVIPNHSGRTVEHLRPGKPDLVAVDRQVPLRAPDRAAINRLLDRFVVTAVARRNPAEAFALATPALRAGTTRTAWNRGDVPVQPLPVRGTRFHGWDPSYSFRNEVNFELLVHARAGSRPSAITYSVDVKRINGRWLVDSFIPNAIFDPPGAKGRVITQLDYGPGARTVAAEKHVSSVWRNLPLLLLALPVLGLLGLLGYGLHRHRRNKRIYREAALY
jgi:hypothetical protein